MSFFLEANEYFRCSNYVKACQAYISALKINPEFAHYHINLAKAYELSGKSDLARISMVQAGLLDENACQFFKEDRWLTNSFEKKSHGESVLVVLLLKNAEFIVNKTINSLLEQKNINVSIIAVDMNSTDNTLNMLYKFLKLDGKINVIHIPGENKEIWAINFALYACDFLNFDFFSIINSPSLISGSELRRQADEISKSGKLLSFSKNLDLSCGELDSEKYSNVMFKRDVLDLGYCIDAAKGGTEQYVERALSNLSESSSKINNLALRIDLKKILELGRSERKKNKKSIVCGVATIPNRAAALRETVESIIHQVDRLIVYQNGFKEIYDFLKNPKIVVYSSLDTNSDNGDAGKFYTIGDCSDCIYFSIDDDLIYPSDYANTMLNCLERNNYEVIVTCHGRNLRIDASSYYKDASKSYRCLDAVQEDNAFVQFGGTGVMAFSTNLVKIDYNYFKHPNMADIWMGLYAREKNIPIYIVPHAKGWIKHSDKFDLGTTIYATHKNDSSKQDSLVANFNKSEICRFTVKNSNSVANLKLKKIFVAIPTFNRIDLLKRLIAGLDAAAQKYEVHVVIFDDGSKNPVYKEDFSFSNIIDLVVVRLQHHGKPLYWRIVNAAFEFLQLASADYYYYLPDDVEVQDDFFLKTIDIWSAIDSTRKICLNLLNDGREKCWTDFTRVPMSNNSYEFYKSQWLDMAMMFDKKLLRYRVKKISPDRWKTNKNLSSGVGQQLSQRFHEAGYEMFQVKKSFVFHGNHESKMNPEERILNPLITN